VPLTNFTARIVADVIEDDGAETRHHFEIEGRKNGRVARFSVPASSFASMNWVGDHLGAGALVFAGIGLRDHARAAIQILSGDPPEQRVYCHTGWRQLGDSRWTYLHGGGAIGPDGTVSSTEIQVRLSSVVRAFTLPDPPTGEELIHAVRASVRMLRIAPERLVFPVFCATYRAPLAPSDFSVHVEGDTGQFKSELVALAQQHFGPAMDSRHLPGAWSSTENALEGLAFEAKDALVVIDDFLLKGAEADKQRMHAKADRVFRGQGNNAGRQRMRADGTLRPSRPPRGLIVSTGEDIPAGASCRARLWVVEVTPGDISPEILTLCQQDARAGLYASAMAGFIQWLSPQYQEVAASLPRRAAVLRGEIQQRGHHPRTPDIMAHLLVGLEQFLRYGADVGALTQVEAEEIWAAGLDALLVGSETQAQRLAESDPARRYLELLAAAIAS